MRRSESMIGGGRSRAATGGIALALAALAFTGAARAQDGSVREGRAILDENCSACHAVGGTGESENTLAPPFRVVVRRYPPADLEESLAEGIVTGHPDMPVFELEPPEIADVIAYLDALAVVTEGE